MLKKNMVEQSSTIPNINLKGVLKAYLGLDLISTPGLVLELLSDLNSEEKNKINHLSEGAENIRLC